MRPPIKTAANVITARRYRKSRCTE